VEWNETQSSAALSFQLTTASAAAVGQPQRAAWIAELGDPRGAVREKALKALAGLGKQKTLRDYLNRPAINGRDDRGGAMGLLFATELMASK
jgi:hypothetical protein